jgi:hypothetical protein
MRTFKVEIKRDGTWHKVNAVFPFSSGELLDERLDEAYVTIYDRTENHRPTTEFRVTHYSDGVQDGEIEYYILAQDKSVEMPSGSGKYKHQLYLIERTKLLEGIICPSITFTSTYEEVLKQKITANKVTVLGYQSTEQTLLWDGNIGYTLPDAGDYFTILSPYDVAKECVDKGTGATEDKINGEQCKATIEVYSNGGKISPEITQNDWTTTVYTATLTNDNDGILALGDQVDPNTGEKRGIEAITGQVPDRIVIKYTLIFDYSKSQAYPRDYIGLTLSYDIPVYFPDKKVRPLYNNITEYILRILEISEPLQYGQNQRFTFDGVTYTNGVASEYAEDSQAEAFSKIPSPPEFTLTQSTLREQLRVIGSYIHAEPYLDGDNVVHFLDYGQADAVEAPSAYISHTRTWDINQYCTDIRSNAQNLVSSLSYAKGAVTEPIGGSYRALQSETVYERLNDENGICKTDGNIYESVKVYCGLAYGRQDRYTGDNDTSPWITGYAQVGNVTLSPKDITPYIYEYTVYASNLLSAGSIYPNSKAYALYYTLGQPGIKGLFYKAPNAVDDSFEPYAIVNILAHVNGIDAKTLWNYIKANGDNTSVANLVFQVTYKPIGNAVVSHGKQDYVPNTVPFSKVYNQSDNLIETEYYGENIKGVAARLGNVDQERTYVLNSRSQIPRIGNMICGYAISAIYSEYMPYYIKCTVALTKDFNRISEYIGINSIKRMYEISERQTQRRDVLIKEYAVISTNRNAVSDSNAMFNEVGLVGIQRSFFPKPAQDNSVKYVRFEAYDVDLNRINNYSMWLPCSAIPIGNTVTFSFSAKDNYSIGTRSKYEVAYGSDGAYRLDITGRWSADVPYSDEKGSIYYASIGLFGTPSAAEGWTEGQAQANSAFQYPLASTSLGNAKQIATGYDYQYGGTPHRLRKDNREIISYTLELEVKTDNPDLIIGSGIASQCSYIPFNSSSMPHIYGLSSAPNRFGLYLSPAIIVEDVEGSTTSIRSKESNNAFDGASLTLLFRKAVADQPYWAIAVPSENGMPKVLLAGPTDMLMDAPGSYPNNDYPKMLNLYFVTKKP